MVARIPYSVPGFILFVQYLAGISVIEPELLRLQQGVLLMIYTHPWWAHCVCICNILHYIIFKEEKGTSSESIEHFLKLFLRWTSGADHGRVLLVTGSFSSMTQGAWQTCRSDLSLILATMTVPQPSETYRNQHNNGIAIKIAASWWIFYARGWQLNRSKVRLHLKEILTDFLNY